jgi:hypothetical protein
MTYEVGLEKCGCAIYQDHDTRVHIVYCNKHEAALDLYGALKLALFPLRDYNKGLRHIKLDMIVNKIEKALAKAEGKDA